MEADLLELEQRFWEASSAGNGNFYRAEVTDDALYVFPGPTGVVSKEECATAVEENATPWASFRIEEPRFLRLGDGAMLLTYTARAQHEGGELIVMRASTVYRESEAGWKLAFHQQTMAPND